MGRTRYNKKNYTCPQSKMIREDEDERILNTQYRFLFELAQEKYAYENQREQELVQQSGQLQAAFSFVTAAVFMAFPIAMEYHGSISITYFFVAISIIVFFLLLSLVFASVATWRWKKVALGNITELKKTILEGSDWEKYQKEYNCLAARIDVLEKEQVRKETLNDKRAMFIHISLITFFCSIGSVGVSYMIFLYMLLR